MKKWMAILLAALVLALPLAVAVADIPWEPFDDFRDVHGDDCVYDYENYTAARDIDVWLDPETPTVVFTVGEGDNVYAYCTYKDDQGVLWGMIAEEEYGKTGWLPLGYTLDASGNPVKGGPVDRIGEDGTVSFTWVWAVVAVAVVVIAAVVVLLVVFRKKKGNAQA